MLRLFILTISILYSCFTLAKSNYQVDLIIFAYPQSSDRDNNPAITSPLLPIAKNAIILKSNSTQSYSLLPGSKSSLKDQYYLLNHKSTYRILAHYSWIQPSNNKSRIALPNVNLNGWQMQGTVCVRQSSYYHFDAHLQLSPPNHPESFFNVTQNQRLKGDEVYFLDHPQIGMLVKIHQLT